MRWEYWIDQYLNRFCMARGLSATSIKTYEEVLLVFAQRMSLLGKNDPLKVDISDFFEYMEYLKAERGNGQSSLFKNAGVVKNFFHGLESLGHILPNDNPMRGYRKIKPPPRKFRDVLSRREVKRLLEATDDETVLGVRDRALIMLLYSTGIRASECTGLKECDVDLEGMQIKVLGKGGDERLIPLSETAARSLRNYRKVRGEASGKTPFFKTRLGVGVTRKGVYDRLKYYVRKVNIRKKISPHNLRHTFATHTLKQGVNIVTLKELLGHRSIMSTMVYIRMTMLDLRKAINQHPVNSFGDIVDHFLPDVRLPYQLSRSGFK
jgi:integrase/recombinase XerD